jgi:hypothetical protein
LDDIPLWRGDHVAIRQLVEDFAQYIYLPRLAGPEVLLQAVRDGVALLTWQTDTFAYAESYDETAGRYRGLRGGQTIIITTDTTGILVKADVAQRQMNAEVPPPKPDERKDDKDVVGPRPPGPDKPDPVPTQIPQRFHGTVRLDPARVGRDAGRIADEVVSHLAGQVGASVRVTLEIEASLPNGVSDQIVRTVTENSRTLKFTSQGFERE